ncbi:hypothetical protein DOTSEDRAFT_74643 [Dothistroma septosporum NZE10]|uniref:Uncharacterized protein n=1 Tax=Dothistroma septosporum (strain NZE10 / CBS 128990) TaxID=675120 RepID=N1PC82_DOTSN|nr:hypothetical protein DOTSEDRAFT_74643 [Dothistroma septosporum NZE10]
MQYGPLTPLGRQLRSVLVNIAARSPARISASTTRHLASSPRNAVESARGGHGSHVSSELYKPFSKFDESETAAVHDGDVRQNDHQVRGNEPHFTKIDGRWFRRARTDHLTEALDETCQLAINISKRRHRIDLSYASPQDPTIREDFGQQVVDKTLSEDKRLARLYDVSIQRILADFVRHKARSADYLAAEWDKPFELSPTHADYLQQKLLDLKDIEAWADIVTARDSLDAARQLAQYAESRGSDYFPIFVYLNVLKREHIGARALRLLIHHATIAFRERARSVPHPDYDRHAILLTVTRLLRHARETWPQSMRSVVQLMLDHLQRCEIRRPYDRETLSAVTYELNKIMGLVSYTTATQPFKDNPHQEAAIVPILRYMAEHDPPLHIDRQGYRAVVRIQLAQRKTSNEIQWAELKALSWPPWKVDRTAMDFSIDAEYGTSRAGATLTRMKEAGYRPLHWETAAELYTGWDPDGTPTVQMRALHEQPGARMSTKYAHDDITWAAKIASTRTIQEAWAGYLAWEDEKLPHDQDVYLAVLVKLRQEKLRQHGHGNYRPRDQSTSAWSLLPGDSIEVAPLPPSTHLYTYTRTPPPTVEDFYKTLKTRDVHFEGYCLAFLIQHAPTLQEAVRRIMDSSSTYPDVAGVLVSDSTCDIRMIPAPVYAAIVEVFARFGRVPLSKALSVKRTSTLPPLERFSIDNALNPALSITRAIDLLRERPVVLRRLWTVLLVGLTNARNYAGLSMALTRQVRGRKARASDVVTSKYLENPRGVLQLPPEIQRHAGAINAHRIARRLLALMRQNYLDPDITAFHSFCFSTESMVAAAWSILQRSEVDVAAGVKNNQSFWLIRENTRTLLHTQRHHERLKGEFRVLVGADDPKLLAKTFGQQSNSAADLPRLLIVPGPALLHAYIRALGWLGDHDGLLATVQWMHDHRTELAERQSHDRNGVDMMRRLIVALRVFLERSWLTNSIKEDEPEGGYPSGSARFLLSRLRRPASPEVIGSVRALVEGVEEWEGWSTDEEVEEYASDQRFECVKLP